MWATGQGGVCFSQTFLRSDDEGEDDEDEDEEEEEEEEEGEEEEEEDEEEEEEEEPQQEEQGEESSTPSRKGQGPNSGVSPAGQSPAPGPGVLRPLPREGGVGVSWSQDCRLVLPARFHMEKRKSPQCGCICLT